MFKKYTKREKKNFPFVVAMLAFPILQFLVFYVYINLQSFVLAFTDVMGNFTLNNFAEVIREWSNPSLLSLPDSLIRSVITWSLNTLIVFPCTVMITYALYKKIPGELVFRVIFYLPSIVGSVVLTTLFRYLLDGPICKILYEMNLISDELYQLGFFYGDISFKTILLYGVWIGLCGNIVILTGSLARIPEEVLESAKIDGAGFFQEFFHIVLPLIWPTVSMLLIYTLAGIFTADNGTYLLTGLGNKTASTGGYYIFTYIYYVTETGNVNGVHYPAAVGLFITLITLPLVLIIRYLLEKNTEDIVY